MTQKPVLIAYATRRGSTREVAEYVGSQLARRRFDVVVEPAATVANLTGVGGVVLGSPVHEGVWLSDAVDFIDRNRDELAVRPVALFALGALRRARDWARPGAWDELSIMCTRYPDIRPVALALFGGALRKADLALIERLRVRRLPDGDFRDWEAIASWAEVVADTLASRTNGRRRVT